MSFSSDVKEELARVFPRRKCCRKSELLGLIKASGSLRLDQTTTSIDILADSSLVARKAFLYVKHLYDAQPLILVRRSGRQNYYKVRVTDETFSKQVVQEISGSESMSAESKRCCRRAFLRGLFLGAGFVSPPAKAHHLEISVSDSATADMVIAMLDSFGVGAKMSRRKKGMFVYIKHGGDIADLLNVIGAHSCLLEYENVRAYKTMKSRVNRLVNMETANLTKVARAALLQVSDIELIGETVGLESLPESLQEIARLRLEHKEATLAELGKMSRDSLGKSGVNHRMRKISEIARKVRESQGIE